MAAKPFTAYGSPAGATTNEFTQAQRQAEQEAARKQAEAKVALDRGQLAREMNHANTLYAQRTGQQVGGSMQPTKLVGLPDLSNIKNADDIAKLAAGEPALLKRKRGDIRHGTIPGGEEAAR